MSKSWMYVDAKSGSVTASKAGNRANLPEYAVFLQLCTKRRGTTNSQDLATKKRPCPMKSTSQGCKAHLESLSVEYLSYQITRFDVSGIRTWLLDSSVIQSSCCEEGASTRR